MDNSIDISRSYFINQSKVRDRNKKRHRLIKNYEKVKNIIINEPCQTKEKSETIKLINKRIEWIKKDINTETLMYSY